MKAKLKLYIYNDRDIRRFSSLCMKIKLENEKFY